MRKNKRAALLGSLPSQHRSLVENAGHVQQGETLAKLEAGYMFREFGLDSMGGYVFYLRKGPRDNYRKGYAHTWIRSDGTVQP